MIFLFALPLFGQSAVPPPNVTYGIQNIGTLPGGDTSIAMAINESGQVAGVATIAGGITRAAFWEPNLETPSKYWLRAMGDLPGVTTSAASWAYSINASGRAVGQATGSDGVAQAFLWEAGTGMRSLGALEAGQKSVARSINDSGMVVGWAGDNYKRRGFVAKLDSGSGKTSLIPLGVPDKDYWCAAFAVNAVGQIVGEADRFDRTIASAFEIAQPDGHNPEQLPLRKPDSNANSGTDRTGEIIRAPHGFVWTPGIVETSDKVRQALDSQRARGSYRSVGHLGGGYAGIFAVNRIGNAAGASRLSSGEPRAVFYNGATRRLTDLGTLGGHGSQAWGINDRDRLVGWALDNSDKKRAFIWRRSSDGNGGTMYDLNDFLDPKAKGNWTLREARAVNNKGQIVGWGIYRDPETNKTAERGFVLTPNS